MTCKCLSLDRWMRSSWALEECLPHYEPAEPLFGRPGIYLLGDKCWFELPDGRAFATDAKHFRYQLAILDAERLNHRQIAALRHIVAQRLATPLQRKLLSFAEESAELRAIRRSALKIRMRVLRKIKAAKERLR